MIKYYKGKLRQLYVKIIVILKFQAFEIFYNFKLHDVFKHHIGWVLIKRGRKRENSKDIKQVSNKIFIVRDVLPIDTT